MLLGVALRCNFVLSFFECKGSKKILTYQIFRVEFYYRGYYLTFIYTKTTMATIKDRIYEYINHKGMTIYGFEMALGKTKSYLRNSQNVSSEMLAVICRTFPDINPEWILLGVGDMTRIPIVEAEPEGDSEQACDITKVRLSEFITKLGITQEQFEVSCGLSRGIINHIKYGINSVSLRKICTRYPQLNAYWLIGMGEQKMMKEEAGYIDVMRRLDELEKKINA